MFLVSFVLFVVFLVLQLCGYIDWSWWWVTAPLWGGSILYVLRYLLSYWLFKQAYKDLFGDNVTAAFVTSWNNRKN